MRVEHDSVKSRLLSYIELAFTLTLEDDQCVDFYQGGAVMDLDYDLFSHDGMQPQEKVF